MKIRIFLMALAAATLGPAPGGARSIDFDESGSVENSGNSSLPAYLQCVPYARQLSGIQIHGDAHTWWGQAEGRYSRGYKPRVGAVMAFSPYGNSTLGHVAEVSKVIDKRTILISHANWSPINGRRGQIEDNVQAVDVSPENDWSQVRVWYAPIQALGGSHWPIEGFIYPGKPRKDERLKPRTSDTSRTINLSQPTPTSNDPIGDIIKQKLGF